MSGDQLDLLGFADAEPPWFPTTPAGRKPASEYELFLALRPDIAGQHAALRKPIELLQQRYRTSASKLRKPALWHVTVLEIGKFTGSYSRESLNAIEAACTSVMSRRIPVVHESLVGFKGSMACFLTCSPPTIQAVAQLQQELAASIRNRQVKCKLTSDAHMTVFYDGEHHLPLTPLDEPLSWIADGFALLCSHKGLSHHEVVRSWPAPS